MLSRLRFVRPLLRKRQGIETTNSLRRKSKWADGGDHATHNDLPVPEGNWKEYQAKRNLVNNLVFFTGTAALIAAIYLICNSEDVYFNFSPPEHFDSDVAECGCEAHAGHNKN